MSCQEKPRHWSIAMEIFVWTLKSLESTSQYRREFLVSCNLLIIWWSWCWYRLIYRLPSLKNINLTKHQYFTFYFLKRIVISSFTMTIGGLNGIVTEQFSCSHSVLLLQHNIVLRQMQGCQPFAFLNLVRSPCTWLFNVQSTLYFSEYLFHKPFAFFIN
jgi:hypothetical protein